MIYEFKIKKFNYFDREIIMKLKDILKVCALIHLLDAIQVGFYFYNCINKCYLILIYFEYSVLVQVY